MKKLVNAALCLCLVIALIPVGVFAEGGDSGEGGHPPEDKPGAFGEPDGSGNYTIDDDIIINTTGASVLLSSCDITINENYTVTIGADGRIELRDVELINYGTIVIECGTRSGTETDPSNEGCLALFGSKITNNGTVKINAAAGDNPSGRLEVRDDGENEGVFENTASGRLIIDGCMEVRNGADFKNAGSAEVKDFLLFAEGAVIENSSGGSVTGIENGKIMLDNPSNDLGITGLVFYEDADDVSGTTELDGEFVYNSDSGKWVRLVHGGPGDPGGGDPGEPGDQEYTITLTVGPNGSATSVTRKDGDQDEPVEPNEVDGSTYTYTVPAGSDVTFTFAPAAGYIIDELRVGDRPEWADQDNKFILHNVRSHEQIEITFLKVETYTITVGQADNVTITVEKDCEPVIPDSNNQFTSQTRDMVRYYFQLDPGYKIFEVRIRTKAGGPI